VQGNHDRNVETPHRYEHNEMAHAGLELAQQELTDEQREWLTELPLRTKFAEDAYQLVHSHPNPKYLPRGRRISETNFVELPRLS
jgi:hypothetical protein